MRGTRLIALVLGSTILALVVQGPAPANAQRGRTPYRVGVVNDARAANHPTVHGLKAGLRDLGLEEGRDVVYDIPAIDGDPDRLAGAARALCQEREEIPRVAGRHFAQAHQGRLRSCHGVCSVPDGEVGPSIAYHAGAKRKVPARLRSRQVEVGIRAD